MCVSVGERETRERPATSFLDHLSYQHKYHWVLNPRKKSAQPSTKPAMVINWSILPTAADDGGIIDPVEAKAETEAEAKERAQA